MAQLLPPLISLAAHTFLIYRPSYHVSAVKILLLIGKYVHLSTLQDT